MAQLVQFQVIDADSVAAKNFLEGARIYALDSSGQLWFGKREQGKVDWSQIRGPSLDDKQTIP